MSSKPAPLPSLTPLSGVTTWLVALASVFVAGVGLAGAAALFAIDSGLPAGQAVDLLSDPRSSPLFTHPTWISVTILVNELSVAAALWFCLRRLKLRFRDVAPFKRLPLQAFFGTLVLVFGLAPIAELCAELTYRYVSRDLISEQVVLAVARGSSPAMFVLVVLIAALVPALVEETFFRGLVMRAFDRYGPFVSIAITSLLFGALHLEPTQAAGTVVLGVGFGLARLATGSLTAPVVGHAVYNAAVVISERWVAGANTHELAPGRALVGALAAAFGFWLLLHQREREEAV